MGVCGDSVIFCSKLGDLSYKGIGKEIRKGNMEKGMKKGNFFFLVSQVKEEHRTHQKKKKRIKPWFILYLSPWDLLLPIIFCCSNISNLAMVNKFTSHRQFQSIPMPCKSALHWVVTSNYLAVELDHQDYLEPWWPNLTIKGLNFSLLTMDVKWQLYTLATLLFSRHVEALE